jgi:hypothetical protein
MITIKELSIDNESAEKIIDLIKKHEPKIWNVLKVELKQLTLTDVGCSFDGLITITNTSVQLLPRKSWQIFKKGWHKHKDFFGKKWWIQYAHKKA